jgi:hypothetical protein
MKRGNQQETTSLNINLKTISKSYLLELIEASQEPAQIRIVNQYITDKANFTTTRKLFGVFEESS